MPRLRIGVVLVNRSLVQPARYFLVSVVGYAYVFIFANSISDFFPQASIPYLISYGSYYLFDFLITAKYVFSQKLTSSMVSRFIMMIFIFLVLGNQVLLILLIYFENVGLASILVGALLSPIKFLISRNLVYTNKRVPIAIRDMLGQATRNLDPILRISSNIERNNLLRDRTKKYWLRSLFGFQNVEVLVSLDVPWWPYSAAKTIEDFLYDKVSPKVFEWGSGASTIWLANRADQVVSIEHDQEWAVKMHALLVARGIDNTKIIHVPAPQTASPVVRSNKAGYELLDFANYVDAIDGFEQFDLIVIDGRARLDCLKKAKLHLKEGGMILLDNSNRKRYQVLDDQFEVLILEGLTPASLWKTQSKLFKPRITSNFN
jgi:hypothetical protein